MRRTVYSAAHGEIAAQRGDFLEVSVVRSHPQHGAGVQVSQLAGKRTKCAPMLREVPSVQINVGHHRDRLESHKPTLPCQGKDFGQRQRVPSSAAVVSESIRARLFMECLPVNGIPCNGISAVTGCQWVADCSRRAGVTPDKAPALIQRDYLGERARCRLPGRGRR